MIDRRVSLSGDGDTIRIVWDPKYQLGITVIDDQHKQLVALCNNLYEAVMKNRDSDDWRAAVKGTLQECIDYVKTHFRNEELLMEASDYENFGEHKKQHDEFTLEVIKMAQGFDQMTITDALRFDKFLYDWILSHIAFYDKQYVPAVKKYAASRNS